MIKWNILQMNRQGDTGLVVKVFYEVIAKGSGIMKKHSGKVTLSGDEQDPNFVSYNELTEDIVISWVKDVLGDQVNEIESELMTKVSQSTLKDIKSGLPWRKLF